MGVGPDAPVPLGKKATNVRILAIWKLGGACLLPDVLTKKLSGVNSFGGLPLARPGLNS